MKSKEIQWILPYDDIPIEPLAPVNHSFLVTIPARWIVDGLTAEDEAEIERKFPTKE